jgi:ABC-2 type transport system ATP-binding protein
MAEVLTDRARAGVPVVFSSHQLDLVERLCDAVAIIKDGRLVAAGEVAELRARGARGLWRVDVDGPDGAAAASPAAGTAVGVDHAPERSRGAAAGAQPAADPDAGMPAWLRAVPGAALAGRDERGLLVRLADGTDEQALLDAARAAGRVRRFEPVEPSLSELFREAVAA